MKVHCKDHPVSTIYTVHFVLSQIYLFETGALVATGLSKMDSDHLLLRISDYLQIVYLDEDCLVLIYLLLLMF